MNYDIELNSYITRDRWGDGNGNGEGGGHGRGWGWGFGGDGGDSSRNICHNSGVIA